ncbi:MAG: hypothetical protein ABI599_16050 [Flavobacteriales bacterium]
MARKRRGSGLLRWLLVLGLPVGLLFALFNTGWYERVDQWPLGITAGEVAVYAGVFDLRNEVGPTEKGELWTITTGQHTGKKKRKKLSDADWRAALFSGEGYSDSVEVRRMAEVDGGWEIRFPKDNYFKAQRRLLLVPKNGTTERANEAIAMAKYLKLAAPERTAVRAEIDGNRSEFIAEEFIDAIFLDKRGYSDAALFTQGFSSLLPEHWRPDTDGDSALAEEIIAKEHAIISGSGSASDNIDVEAAAAWLLLCEAEGRRDAIMDEATYAYDRSTGRIVPLYRPQHGSDAWRSDGEPVVNLFSALISRADFREHMAKAKTGLMEKWPTATFSDPEWLSRALPDAHNPVHAEEEAAAVPFGNTLADIAARIGCTVSGDTLNFVRGKYRIEDDVITPPGTTVILGKGTRWFIAAGKRVEVNGTLVVNGTGPNPVFIRPADDAPYVGVAVNGVPESRCSMVGLQMSGGSSADGMLNFRNTDVTMIKCILSGAEGTLVSVQRGSVDVSGCAFMGAKGDGMRLVNATGKVEACNFQRSTGQATGDGLVVSGGKLEVRDAAFNDLVGTGLLVTSGAEVSAERITASNCATGVAAVDGAALELRQATITRNRVGLRGMRTQQHRKGGSITLHACTLEGNGKERELDEVSRVVEAGE